MSIVEHFHDDVFESKSTLFVDTTADVPLPNGPNNLCIAKSPEDFPAISQQGKNVLIYFWSISAELDKQISIIPYNDLPECSLVLSKDEVNSLSWNRDQSLVDIILCEMRVVLQNFAKILPTEFMKIEFCKTQDRSCPIFHVDRHPFRLLCTFRGPGTEWLADSDVNRKKLSKGSNRKIVKESAILHEVQKFQICILKGEPRINNIGEGAVHRSPAVPLFEEGRWFMRADAYYEKANRDR